MCCKICWRLGPTTPAQSFDRDRGARRPWLHIHHVGELFSLPRNAIGPVGGIRPVRGRHWFAGAGNMGRDGWKRGRGIPFIQFVDGRKRPGEVRGATERGVMTNTRHLDIVLLGRRAGRVCRGRWPKTRDGYKLSRRGPGRDGGRGRGSVRDGPAIGLGTRGWDRGYETQRRSSVRVGARGRSTWGRRRAARGNDCRWGLRSEVLRRWALYPSAKFALDTTPLKLSQPLR